VCDCGAIGVGQHYKEEHVRDMGVPAEVEYNEEVSKALWKPGPADLTLSEHILGSIAQHGAKACTIRPAPSAPDLDAMVEEFFVKYMFNKDDCAPPLKELHRFAAKVALIYYERGIEDHEYVGVLTQDRIIAQLRREAGE